MEKIDTKKPIRFFDDRGKNNSELILDKILYENNTICLGTIKDGELEGGPEILFNKINGKVLTENLQFWQAENHETEQYKLAYKMINFTINHHYNHS